jgi:hypothetical protein
MKVRAMKTMTLILAVLAAVGCRTTYQVGDGPGDIGPRDAFEKLRGEEAMVTLVGGQITFGTLVGYAGDTLLFERPGRPAPIALPSRQVSSAAVQGSRTPGTLAGGVAGGFLGGFIGSQTTDKKEKGVIDLVNEQKMGTVVGVSLGAVLGGIIGGYAVPNTIVVRFARGDSSASEAVWAEEARRASQVIGLVVPVLREEGITFVSFDYAGKMIRIPRRQVTLERRPEGVLIRATRSVFRDAGIKFD